MKSPDTAEHAKEDAPASSLRARIRELEARNRDLERQVQALGQLPDDLELAREIINHSPVFLFRRPLDAGAPPLVYASPSFAVTGYQPEDITSGRVTFNDIVHPDDRERANRESEDYAARGVKEFTQVYRIVTRSGETRWVEDRTSVVTDPRDGKRYHQGVIADITARKRAEIALRKSEEKYRRIVETAAEGFMLIDERMRIVDVNSALCRLLGYRREEALGRNPLDFTSPDYRAHLRARRDDFLTHGVLRSEGDLVAKDGRRIPVAAHGSLLRNDAGEPIGRMAFITDMTAHKKALVLAGEVQKSLLPRRAPTVPGLTAAGCNRSCDEIGGDYFDYIRRADMPAGSISLVVGDVSGHGLDAALLMTAARAFLRMRASQAGTPAEIVSDMNRHLAGDLGTSSHFMTLCFLTVDLEKGALSWVRAGHDPALCYDPQADRFADLTGDGLALGIDAEARYALNTRGGLRCGQVIAVGTDGIWEARDPNGHMFGKARFKDVIRRHHQGTADQILDAVFGALENHTRGVRAQDDMTLVIVKIEADLQAMYGSAFDI
jgi:sigma-B regulation protein RsbU (phosphoserine phosphatase)